MRVRAAPSVAPEEEGSQSYIFLLTGFTGIMALVVAGPGQEWMVIIGGEGSDGDGASLGGVVEVSESWRHLELLTAENQW